MVSQNCLRAGTIPSTNMTLLIWKPSCLVQWHCCANEQQSQSDLDTAGYVLY